MPIIQLLSLSFYIDGLKKIFTYDFENLLDLNRNILGTMLDILGIEADVGITENFKKEYVDAQDFRYFIQPKKQVEFTDFNPPEYFQVFNTKFGFRKDLSILDLIFNMGPEAYGYLCSC